MSDTKYYAEVKPRDASPESADALREKFGVFAWPEWYATMMSAFHILFHQWGYLKSAELKEPVDADGRPLPMYSYALIDYLDGLDLRDKSVFEFGAGNSTLFWAARAKSVHALETNAQWAEKLNSSKPENCRLDIIAKGTMPSFFRGLGQSFDIIVVDCAENRYDCAAAARASLNPGGFLILDNADWYPNASKMLRESGLLQVDFSGLRPCRPYACVTSLFLDRAFEPKPRHAHMPIAPIGGKQVTAANWDSPTE